MGIKKQEQIQKKHNTENKRDEQQQHVGHHYAQTYTKNIMRI